MARWLVSFQFAFLLLTLALEIGVLKLKNVFNLSYILIQCFCKLEQVTLTATVPWQKYAGTNAQVNLLALWSHSIILNIVCSTSFILSKVNKLNKNFS